MKFFDNIELWKILFLFSIIFDLSSTLFLTNKYGIGIEKNFILRWLIQKPYFSIVYTFGIIFNIILLSKSVFEGKFSKYFCWIILLTHFFLCGFLNTLMGFGIVG